MSNGAGKFSLFPKMHLYFYSRCNGNDIGKIYVEIQGGQVTPCPFLGAPMAAAYRSDRQAVSTARFCRAGQLATTDTCHYLLPIGERSIAMSKSVSLLVCSRAYVRKCLQRCCQVIAKLSGISLMIARLGRFSVSLRLRRCPHRMR